jgi:drug/metabolite transporter (DMT)-like permease
MTLEKSNAWKDSTTAGALLALLAAFGFSLKAIFVKLAYPYGVDAITLLALRMGFSLPVFLWVGLVEQRAGASLSRDDWGRLFLLGCFGYYGASILDFWGLEYISAGLERLILFTYPTLTILIGVLFQGKAFTRREGIAVALCYCGIGFAFMHDLGLNHARDVWIGGALVFGSSVSYAIYLSGSAPMIGRLGAMRFTALATLVSVSSNTAALCRHPPVERLHPALAGLWLGAGDGAVRHHYSGLCPIGSDSPAWRRTFIAVQHGRAAAHHRLRLVAA